MTGEIFISLPAFYQSTMILDQQSIRLKEYTKFVTHHFQKSGKYINKNVISEIYQLFDGIICYIRSMIVFEFWLGRTLKN